MMINETSQSEELSQESIDVMEPRHFIPKYEAEKKEKSIHVVHSVWSTPVTPYVSSSFKPLVLSLWCITTYT